jgi:hypothetical protein
MSATKENLAFNSITSEYEFQGYGDVDDSDYQYSRDVELFGLGVRLHIGDAWMWFAGYKFGCAIVTDKMEESARVAPEHLEQLCEHLRDEGYSISLALRK